MTGQLWDAPGNFPYSKFCEMSIQESIELARNAKMREKARELMEQGYRRVSNKHCIISRVDRPDWKWFMADTRSPHDYTAGTSWVKCLGLGAADFYRRVYSKDTKVVTLEIAKHIESSNNSSISFVLLKSQEKKDMRQLHKFKIHGADTVHGVKRSRDMNKFYDSYEEAEKAARKCVASDGCEIVIFEAIKLVKPAMAPILVEDVPKGRCVGTDGAGNPVYFNDEP